MKDWPFQIAKDFESFQELVQIIGQPWLRVSLLRIWKQIDLGPLALWLGRKSGVHVEEAIAYKPADGRHDCEDNQETWNTIRMHMSVNWSGDTYRVVAFMVKVRLVENNVNSHVGSVMVVNVMSQTRQPGMILNTKSTNLQNAPHMLGFALP